MKIVIAPDSYKECLPAREVASVMADAVRSSLPTCNLRIFPLADGGEGTLDALVPALGGRMEQVNRQNVAGPQKMANLRHHMVPDGNYCRR